MNSARTLGVPVAQGRGDEAPAWGNARVVVDTNAVLDLWVFADAGVQGLRAAVAQGRLDWLGTAAMRQELAAVLARGVGERYGAPADDVLRLWDRHVRVCPPPTPSGAHRRLRCRDPDDQPFLDLALDSQAQWLLTSDRDLLSLARKAKPLGLQIRSPRGWPDEKRPPRPMDGGGPDGAERDV